MRDYRIFPTNETGGVIGPAEIVSCATDQEAIERARAAVESHGIEIWDGARRVASIPGAKRAG